MCYLGMTVGRVWVGYYRPILIHAVWKNSGARTQTNVGIDVTPSVS